MTHDDVIFRMRVALFAHAERVGVTRACRDFGGPPLDVLPVATASAAVG